ncbi:hypothetical protein [uncultured Jannaschia sp.]|uniref:hypothetical protein n=1 Tax=uncultured Jannaschia sp. TaxID=293347 RepID=UPI00261F2133|nr:hypothetical protein [uncultured Jannaschia sp.]
MLTRLNHFLSDETGAVTLDWVVLTAALVGTGLAVMNTVSQGVQTVSVDTAAQLRGQVIEASFGSDYCSGGLAGLQAREDARVAAAGGTRIDVDHFMSTYHADQTDTALLAEHTRLSQALGSGDDWTRERTVLSALECELVLRGLD